MVPGVFLKRMIFLLLPAGRARLPGKGSHYTYEAGFQKSRGRIAGEPENHGNIQEKGCLSGAAGCSLPARWPADFTD
jgi:hypothetical protein